MTVLPARVAVSQISLLLWLASQLSCTCESLLLTPWHKLTHMSQPPPALTSTTRWRTSYTCSGRLLQPVRATVASFVDGETLASQRPRITITADRPLNASRRQRYRLH